MKDFRKIKFAKWFENKLMKDPWNTAAMVNNGFEFEVLKETEKAVQIKIINTNKFMSSWNIWAPKSSIENIEYLGL